MFDNCSRLEHLIFRKRDGFLQESIPGEVIFPGTLAKIGKQIFWECDHINVVWVDPDCTADVRQHMKTHIAIFKKEMKFGSQPLWNMRRLKDVVIPSGTKRI